MCLVLPLALYGYAWSLFALNHVPPQKIQENRIYAANAFLLWFQGLNGKATLARAKEMKLSVSSGLTLRLREASPWHPVSFTWLMLWYFNSYGARRLLVDTLVASLFLNSKLTLMIDQQLVAVGLATAIYFLAVSYFKGPTRKVCFLYLVVIRFLLKWV